MTSSVAFVLALLFAFVNAGKFSLPLYQEINVRGAGLIHKRHEAGGGDSQRPFQNAEHPPVNTNKDKSPALYDSGYGFYTTNITLGTPPQPFRAIIDLNAADLFVPSISCGGSHCNDGTKDTYDFESSSTFQENGTIMQKFYGPIHGYGIVNEETLRLGELEVRGQQFLELKYYDSVYPDDDVLLFDSVLGLGYDGFMFDNPYYPNVLPSPFHTIVSSGLLDANQFALQIPRSVSDSGDLTFGGVNEEFVGGEMVGHSLFPEDTPFWQIEMSSFAMSTKDCGEEVTLFNETLSNFTAVPWSTYPGILLPYKIAEKALWKINTKRSSCTSQTIVDCDTVSSLPEITLGFPGQEIVLKGEDYTMLHEEANPRFCSQPIKECWLMVEQGPGPRDMPQNLIVLGTSFLKKVYAVFDLDERSISFGKSKS